MDAPDHRTGSDNENLPDGSSSSSNGDYEYVEVLGKRLCESDQAAFEQIFRRLSPRIFRFVRGMIADDAKAHDITQDTFAALWKRRDQLEGVDALTPYIFKMARHRVYNAQRDANTRRSYETEAPGEVHNTNPPSPEDELDAELLRTLLDTWIDDLPPRQREVLTLRRIKGLSHTDIAETMDIAPSTVNNHLTRALKQLREHLRTHRPDLLS